MQTLAEMTMQITDLRIVFKGTDADVSFYINIPSGTVNDFIENIELANTIIANGYNLKQGVSKSEVYARDTIYARTTMKKR